jgi:hypothetical protein
MGIRRPRKRYGSVNGLGRCYIPRHPPKPSKDKPKLYTVPAGTACEVRKVGSKDWKAHQTKRPVTSRGFMWRNGTHYGFAFEGYEVKVQVGRFLVA